MAARVRALRLAAAVVQLTQRRGVPPSRRELALELGCSPGTVHRDVWHAVALELVVQRREQPRAVRATAAAVLELEGGAP